MRSRSSSVIHARHEDREHRSHTAVAAVDRRPATARLTQLAAIAADRSRTTSAPMAAAAIDRRPAAAQLTRLAAIANQPAQRRAYIGPSYAAPSSLATPEMRAMSADDRVRRFDNQEEFERFAAGGRLQGKGPMPDGRWVRLPDKMLVLGEDHGSPLAPQIIAATNTTRFRYEGFAHHSATRKKNNADLARHLKAGDAKGLESKGLTAGAQEPTHEAEHALPKYARAVADVVGLAASQAGRTDFGGGSVAPGTEIGAGYSLPKALLKSLLSALIYAKSYGSKWMGHPLKAFYKANATAVTASIAKLKENLEGDRMVMPNFAELPITAGLGNLTTAYESAAKAKVGLSEDADLDQFKEQLNLVAEPRVAETDRAKANDYLRDASMFKTIKEAAGKGDKLFVIGDAHRHKLEPLIKGEALPVMTDTDFVAQQDQLNQDARAQFMPPDRASLDAAKKSAERVRVLSKDQPDNYKPNKKLDPRLANEIAKLASAPTKIGEKFGLSIDGDGTPPERCAWRIVDGAKSNGVNDYEVTKARAVLELVWTNGPVSEVIKEITLDMDP